MKVKDLRAKSPAELEKHLDKMRAELAKVRQEKLTKNNPNTKQEKMIRKEIARSMTLIKESEKGQEK